MLRITLLLFLSTLLHGCAYLHSLSSDLPQKIDGWVAAHEYGQALDTLSHVSKTHKQYALLKNKKRTVLIKAKDFEHSQHLAAQKQENNKQWHKADNIYTYALEKYPQSSLLRTEYQSFKKRRDKYLTALETKLSIAKGNWLIESTPLQEKIARATPDDYYTQRRFNKNNQELQATADERMGCAETAIQSGHIPLAEKCLDTADRLNPAFIDKNKLKKLKAQLDKKQQLIVKEENRKTSALLSELKQGYSHDNLLRARRHLSEVRDNKKRNKESVKLEKQLEKYIKTGLTQRMEAGRRLYSDGQIQQALSIWIPLKSIAPDNTKLNDHIERAKRVLNKLEKLSNTPPAITLPQ